MGLLVATWAMFITSFVAFRFLQLSLPRGWQEVDKAIVLAAFLAICVANGLALSCITSSRALGIIAAAGSLVPPLALLLSVFAVGGLIQTVRQAHDRTPGMCPACGYSLAGIDQHRCPECGWRSSHAAISPPISDSP